MVIGYIIAGSVLMGIAGFIWGIREKFHQTPDWAERIWGKEKVKPVSFWGSRQDLTKYKNGDPEQGEAFFLAKTFPYKDFWHRSKYFINYLWGYGISFALAGALGLQVGFAKLFLTVLVLTTGLTVVQGFYSWLAFYLIGRALEKTAERKEMKKTYEKV